MLGRHTKLTNSLAGWTREDRVTAKGREYSIWIAPSGMSYMSRSSALRAVQLGTHVTSSAPAPSSLAHALPSPPPPPMGWVWPAEGDPIEVEVQLDEAAPAQWVTANVVAVLVDSNFSARIVPPDGSDPWNDWFTWQEEGRDWGRYRVKDRTISWCTPLHLENLNAAEREYATAMATKEQATATSQPSPTWDSPVSTRTCAQPLRYALPSPPPPPMGWVWPSEGDPIEVEVQLDEAAPAQWVTANVVAVLVDSNFSARIVPPDGSDPWNDWFTWQEEGRDWRRALPEKTLPCTSASRSRVTQCRAM